MVMWHKEWCAKALFIFTYVAMAMLSYTTGRLTTMIIMGMDRQSDKTEGGEVINMCRPTHVTQK